MQCIKFFRWTEYIQITRGIFSFMVSIIRSSQPEVYFGKGVLKYAVNLQENTHAEVRFQ